MMNGGREYLANKLGRPVRSPASKAVKLNTPNYTSILGLVDLVLDSIEQRTAAGWTPCPAGLGRRTAGPVREKISYERDDS